MGRWIGSACVLFCGSCSLANPIIDHQINRAADRFSSLVPTNTGSASTMELIYGLIALVGMYMSRKGYLKFKRNGS